MGRKKEDASLLVLALRRDAHTETAGAAGDDAGAGAGADSAQALPLSVVRTQPVSSPGRNRKNVQPGYCPLCL